MVKCKAIKNSPKILGVANAFAGGVFIAIALMHIMPEQVEAWAEFNQSDHTDEKNHGDDEGEKEPFPLPFLLLVTGYTVILMIDKVIFDNNMVHSHDDHDEIAPGVNNSVTSSAGNKLARASLALRQSIVEMQQPGMMDPMAANNLRASQIKLENAVKKEIS